MTGHEKTLAAPSSAQAYFFKKHALMVAGVLVFVVLGGLCSYAVGFSPVTALQEFPNGLYWMSVHFMPGEDAPKALGKILSALFMSIMDSLAAAATAAVCAYICALIGSRTVGFGGIAQFIVRGIASIARNIPTVAWAFVLLACFKQNEFTGYLALFMKSFGFLTRTFLETIDEVPNGPIEALRASGASWFSIMTHAVIPLSMTQIISWLLYMFETNVRDATLVGMLTGTGIGFVFQMYYRSYRYGLSGLVIVCVAIMVIVCEVSSNYVRRRVK